MGVGKQGKAFLNGLVVIVPVVLTGFAVYKVVSFLDRAMLGLVKAMGARSFPGLGFALAIVLIYAVGLLAQSWLLRWPLRLVEGLVDHVPLVKSLYSATKDLLQFLGGDERVSRGRPCLWQPPGGGASLLGLITQDSPGRFLPGEQSERIAVYLPMSYQLGGFTFFVPKDQVVAIEGMTVEECMKLALTAGIGTKEGGPPTPNTSVTDAEEGDDQGQ